MNTRLGLGDNLSRIISDSGTINRLLPSSLCGDQCAAVEAHYCPGDDVVASFTQVEGFVDMLRHIDVFQESLLGHGYRVKSSSNVIR